MPMIDTSATKVLILCALCCACAPPEQEAAGAAAPSVEDLMTNVVMPNADNIWTAVSYVATADGVTETQPETAEDWEALRASANALLDAAAALSDTNREIGEVDPSTTDYQYTPDEIVDLLAENPEPWQEYLREMQETTQLTLQAIELKDLVGLQDFGARINAACEGCHAEYWYRTRE